MIGIIINGCNGKMGQVVASLATTQPDMKVVAGIDKYPDARKNPFPVYPTLEDCKEQCDVIIDFSVPEALPPLLDGALKRKTPLIVATTGLSEEDIHMIHTASQHIPIFRAANMSIGVNLMYQLVQKAAKVLGSTFDIEIIEKHHNQKIDAPSGTAYALADAINEVFLNSRGYIFGRHSKNDKRTKTEIGIHAVRGGTIAGEHNVLFAGSDEELEIIHTAHSKQIFASGALTAARYITSKPPGLYSMKDIMTEKSTVTNIYTSNDEALITINHLPDDPKVITKLFKDIGNQNINIDMISQTAHVRRQVDISFTLPRKDLDKAIQLVEKINESYPSISLDIYRNITKLSVEGVGMEHQSGVAAKVFELMAEQDIQIKAITTSETKISCVIDQVQEKQAVEAIVRGFGL